MNSIKRITMAWVVSLGCHFTWAQNVSSPYTVLGLGELSSTALAHQMAMGGVGIATPSGVHINNLNPALLPYNTLTTFEFGVEGERRTMLSDVNSSHSGSGGFKYITLGIPIMPSKWTASLGAMPYSAVNYNFRSQRPVAGTNVHAIIDFEGNGGVNQVYMSHGVRLTKTLYIGAKAAYVFGLVNNKTSTLLRGAGMTQQFPTAQSERTNYSGFVFGFGAAYQKLLTEKQWLNFGLIYDLSSEIGAKQLVRLERGGTSGAVLVGDTLVNNPSGAYRMPAQLGFGIAWVKANQLTLGLDVKRHFWDRRAAVGNTREEYRSTIDAAIGLEWVPKYNDIDNYLSRIRYRLGFNYAQLPHVIGGQTLNDLGITFGLSLPVKVVSALNLACQIGQRGSTSGGLVQENYVRLVFGVTINQRWFLRGKYD